MFIRQYELDCRSLSSNPVEDETRGAPTCAVAPRRGVTGCRCRTRFGHDGSDMRGLLASPLGFLIGVSLGALGGGGSILAVPALVYGAGQGPKAATATSLLLVGTAALVGMGAHHRAGRVRVGTGVMFGLAGIGGSLAGSALNRGIDPNLLLLGFSLLILVAAWRMVVGCPTCTQVGEAARARATRSRTKMGAPRGYMSRVAGGSTSRSHRRSCWQEPQSASSPACSGSVVDS